MHTSDLLQPIATVLASVVAACLAKRFCSLMSRCAEAVYHLRTCGQRWLDGDGDGKPCARLCG